MKNVLVPLSELGAEEVATQTRQNVLFSRDLLLARYSPGTVARFGDRSEQGEAKALLATERAMKQDAAARKGLGSMWHFAVQDSFDDTTLRLVGIASISRGLALGFARVPFKPEIAKRVPFGYKQFRELETAANVTSWIKTPDPALLSESYSSMVEFANEQGISHTWTIEPKSVYGWIKQAITASGLTPIVADPQRYDVGESQFPPYSDLYSNQFIKAA